MSDDFFARCRACKRGWHFECWGCPCPCNADEPDDDEGEDE